MNPTANGRSPCTHGSRSRGRSGLWTCAICGQTTSEPHADSEQAVGEFFADVGPSVGVIIVGMLLLIVVIMGVAAFYAR